MMTTMTAEERDDILREVLASLNIGISADRARRMPGLPRWVPVAEEEELLGRPADRSGEDGHPDPLLDNGNKGQQD